MKKRLITFAKNTLITTGFTLILLAGFALVVGGCAIYVKTIFEALLVNVCIQLSYLLTQKIETSYFILDAFIDITSIVIIALLFGKLFDWFISTPAWVLITISIMTYIACFLFQIVRVKDDIDFINEKLSQKRK